MSIKIEELLLQECLILEVPTGFSMWPMLKNKTDQIVISSISAPLKIHDVILYKRTNGQYVLHRIIKINKKGYVIRGDNCINSEYDISDEQIFGILQGFYKRDRYIDCENSFLYKFYVLFWRLTFVPRVGIMQVLKLKNYIKNRNIKK